MDIVLFEGREEKVREREREREGKRCVCVSNKKLKKNGKEDESLPTFQIDCTI